MIEFQTDVPMPIKRSGGANAKYPVGQMPVGASFFVAGVKPGSFGGAFAMQKAQGKDFSTRIVTEGGVKGVRVWRTK